MGGGTYSSVSRMHSIRAAMYATSSPTAIFMERSINNAMNPCGVQIRESRDSSEHPESLAIIIALDVTGSMGSVPHYLVKEGLPAIMDAIINSGIKDPQVLFLGIGDHECDHAPLQVGQFESSDELLDKWLTTIFLEGGGGSNYGESYMLAWYFAAYHTDIDCLNKRGQKGFLFTIGDEPVLKSIPKVAIKSIMGDGQYEDFDSSKLLEKAMEKYNCFHIHIRETGSGSRQSVMDHWKQIIQDNLIIANRRQDVASIISEVVSKRKIRAATNQKEAAKEDMML